MISLPLFLCRKVPNSWTYVASSNSGGTFQSFIAKSTSNAHFLRTFHKYVLFRTGFSNSIVTCIQTDMMKLIRRLC
jgi:hypothetical protein